MRAPADARVLHTVEAHTGGELARIVVDGWPELPGRTLLEQLTHQRTHHDSLRRALVCEPRGHAEAYGCVVLPPVHPEADVGALFLTPTGYGSLCGHGLLAMVTWLARSGRVAAPEGRASVCIDTPAGLVQGAARRDDRGWDASIVMPAASVERPDLEVVVDGRGVSVALVRSGGRLVYLPASVLGLDLAAAPLGDVVGRSLELRAAVHRVVELDDPVAVLLHEQAGPDDYLNTCVFGQGQLDRSPTGSGVAGRAALLVDQGALGAGDVFWVSSRTGARFRGRVVGIGPDGVVAEVSGRAHILGRAEWWIDPRDELGAGFLLT